MPIKWNMNVLERRNLDCFGPMIAEFLGIFPSFHRILRYGTFLLLFIRIPLFELAYFQFPVISNKEKFVLALVINIIFPVIYFYDDNPLRLSQIPGNALKDTSVFCCHAANCSQAKEKNSF